MSSPPAAAPLGASVLAPVSAGQRVAVADDDADIRRLLALALRRGGYQVLEAGDGDQALALIRAHRPDVAVLDVLMPGLTGLEVARALRADSATAGIPIVLVSATAQGAEVAANLDAGVAAYIVKPFAPQVLVARVAALIGTPPTQP